MKNERGFSLIELLVVIAIISVLTTIGIMSFTGTQRSARDAQRKNDLRVVQYALAEYYQDNSSLYPIGTINSYTYSSSASNFGTNFTNLVTLLNSRSYMRNTVLTDPRNNSTYFYAYEPLTSGTTFRLKACLEVSTDTQGIAAAATATAETAPFSSGNCPSGRVYVVTNP